MSPSWLAQRSGPAAVLAALALAAGVAHAGPQEDYDAGVAALRAGEVETARRHLEAAVEAGAHDPAVYHALGNALYREQALGAAVAAWTRGTRLAPGDGDLSANLARARREAQDRLEPPAPRLGPVVWAAWWAPARWLQVGAVALGGALLAGAGRAAAARRGAVALGARAGQAAAVLAVVAVAALAAVVVALAQPETVVVLAEHTARSALGPSGVDLFTLHAGAEVEVDERAADHVLVTLPDGRKGWLPQRSVLSTTPSAPWTADLGTEG